MDHTQLKKDLDFALYMADTGRDPAWIDVINRLSADIEALKSRKTGLTLSELQAMFPSSDKTCAIVGRIPMDFVNAHLADIAAIVKEYRLSRRYRGPRRRLKAEQTLREDAVAMMLYRK